MNSFSVALVSITMADAVMSDGERLENVGVIPDVPLGPTPFAISQGLDPVLSEAAKAMGSNLTPKQAGDLHFMIPKGEEESEVDTGDKANQ